MTRYTRPDGAWVEVDTVREGEVYYRAWRPTRKGPRPLYGRMDSVDFFYQMRAEGMVMEVGRCPGSA